MDLHRIRYPLAISTRTGEIVDACDVPNGLNCNCHCHFCKEGLIAINSNGKEKSNKQKDHFRHNLHTKCKADYETYIHWLAKHVIKSLEYIALPNIGTRSIYDDQFLNERSDILNRFGLNPYALNSGNEEVQSETTLLIEHCEVEKRYETKIGEVIPDIVIYHEQQELFIEPFYTNPISDHKHNKLLDLDKSAIAINLCAFVRENDSLFTLKQFRHFLQNDAYSKTWSVLRKEKIKNLQVAYLNELNKRLLCKSEMIKEYKQLENKRAVLSKEIELYHIQIHKLHANIEELNQRRTQIEFDLGLANTNI